jgi:hypothetical protein
MPPRARNIENLGLTTYVANKSEEWHFVPRTRKVYLCPRQIPVHRGRREMCGIACAKAQVGSPVEHEEETYMELVSVEKEVVFNESACRMG